MEKAEKWTKFVDLWVRAGLSHLVRASQNLMCTHCPAWLQRHTVALWLCAFLMKFSLFLPSLIGTGILFSWTLCLCWCVHMCMYVWDLAWVHVSFFFLNGKFQVLIITGVTVSISLVVVTVSKLVVSIVQYVPHRVTTLAVNVNKPNTALASATLLCT